MFYYLYGDLTIAEPGMVVVDCSGVGYKLTTSLITSELLKDALGKKVKVFTHLAVREDGVELFGFESNAERDCFNLLTTVSGVGPKAAMSILSIMTPDNFALAVCSEDVKAISKASGIGGKTAARIILELKDKLAATVSSPRAAQMNAITSQGKVIRSGNLAEATEALMVLGYDKSTVANALAGMDPQTDTGELIRMALKKISR